MHIDVAALKEAEAKAQEKLSPTSHLSKDDSLKLIEEALNNKKDKAQVSTFMEGGDMGLFIKQVPKVF